jgi:hypothetical protein
MFLYNNNKYIYIGDGTSAPQGSTVCIQCLAETYASAENKDEKCQICPERQYNLQNGSSTCLECGMWMVNSEEYVYVSI